MADLTSFGIVSVETALVSRFTMTNSLQEGEVVLDEAGLFHHACAYGEEWMFDVEIGGDLPADFALASSGPAIAGLTGGVSVIDQTGNSQSMGNPNSATASGEHAPAASA